MYQYLNQSINKSKMRYKRREVPPRDHTKIVVPHGSQDTLCKLFDLSPGTVSKYLDGYFHDDNPNVELIECVRERARGMQKGIVLFIARNQDGTLQAFNAQPRRNKIIGKWYDPIDEFNGIHELDMIFPEVFLPEGCDPDWDKRKVETIVIQRI